MSGAERTDIGSAQLKGINESGVCAANVDVVAPTGTSTGTDNLINAENVDSVCSVYFDDGGSLTNWDVGKCLGDSLNPIETLGGGGLGMFGSEVVGCEPVGMGNRMSNCNVGEQPGDGLDHGNVGAELPMDDGESMVCESVKDGSTMPIGGNGETPGAGESLSLEKNEIHSHVSAEEGNQLLGFDVMKQSEEGVVFGDALHHEKQICEPSVLENSAGQECGRSELLDSNNLLSNSVVPELLSESLIPKENAVEIPGQANLQSGSANHGTELSSYAPTEPCGQTLRPNARIGEKEDGFGDEIMFDQPMDEKLSTQLEGVSTAKEDQVEDSSKNNHVSGSVDDLLNKTRGTSNEALECSPERVATSSRLEQIPKTIGQDNHGSVKSEQSEQKEIAASEVALQNTKEEQHMESNCNVIGPLCMDGAQRSPVEEEEKPCQGISGSGGIEQNNKCATSDAKDCPIETSGPLSEDITEKVHVVVLGTPAASGASEKRGRGRPRKTSTVPVEKKYPLRSLRSKSQEIPEAPQTSANLENTGGSTGQRRGRKKKAEMIGKSHDEFARMRKHLRYLLHRIKYERNLLEAYSSEGWRGQSVEKLRPEKELERAKADINRSKLKIRDLFQRLDSISAEGKFPETLFDSEGLIDSEDIFCAKCGSKDLSTGNDIILCDGACDRGFHQFCLEPPLRTEEIPPGDEGWLCPACDCKVDCIELLNDSQGTKLSVGDNWEKIFPEAVAARAGNNQDDIMGLPSDDSDDDEYNPGGTDDEAKAEGSESSSDESNSAESDSSDFSSASEDLGAIQGTEQHLGLPSDDEEDDEDFDPDAANLNDDVEQESSTSDFTSASEDLGAAVDNDDGSNGEPLQPTLETDQDTGDSPPLVGRRHVEKLDYKQLYDETYGNATSDSSDDEDWTDMDATKKRRGRANKGVSVSSNGCDASASPDGTSSIGTSQRRGRKKLNQQPENGSPAQLTKSPQQTRSSGKGVKRPPYNRLSEAVTQRLYESFKENQYPDRERKEKLAEELGLTPQRVDKWFGNARWSFNHHPARIEASMAAVASHSNTQQNVACNGAESAAADASAAISESGGADSSKLDAKDSGKRKYTPRKRKKTEDNQSILQSSNVEVPLEGTQADTLQNPEAHQGVQTRRRKSGA